MFVYFEVISLHLPYKSNKKITFMIKKYFKLNLMLLSVFIFPSSALADGGIPFWINTIQSVAASSGIRGLGYPISSSIITMICLILIIFCETLFLKKRYFKTTNTAKIIEAVSVSNLVSTILGGIFLWGAIYIAVFTSNANSLGYLLFGPLYGILTYLPHNTTISTFGFIFILIFYNIFFCFFSYFIERFIIKKYLQNTYSSEVISKGMLRANILSYSVSFFLILPIYYFLHGILRI